MTRRRPLLILPLLLLAGCFNPTRPEVSEIDPSLPFNVAMEAVIKKDPFLTKYLRPGFHRAADGTMESYTTDAEDGGPATDHLAALTKRWCAQNGGRVQPFPEIPVLQRGVGYVVQLRENLPVSGRGYNLVCFRGREALAAAAIGRTNFFLNANDFRRADGEAGAAIVDLKPRP